MFDYVIVDTPPAFTDQVLAAFDASDLALLLATLDIPALKNLKLSLETLELLNYPKEKVRLILNRADSKVGLDAGEVEKTLRAPISALIPSSRAVPAATNRGVPIVTDQPHHPVSLAIQGFVEQHIIPLSSTSGIPAQLRADRRGLLRRRTRQA
jgi:pilus assembly protein CpaE